MSPEVIILIGEIVTVTVDRPLGSRHPRHGDMLYTVNYGYVDGIIAPDGDEQDAYILGVDEPVESFTGRVIAVVRRLDDVEDKWIVAPDDFRATAEEIAETIRFQEQYFRSELITRPEEDNMEKVAKDTFCVIGKLGSSDDGEGFVQKLWADANAHFAEVEPLAKRNADGSLAGCWGAMTDMDYGFKPWTDDFTRGRYLAGIECRNDAVPPAGWRKWIVPGFTALKVKVESGDTFRETLAYMEQSGIELAGAVQDFTDPATGQNYMLFPTSFNDSKDRLIRGFKDSTDQLALCGLHCEHCYMGAWCGGCSSACNACSYATICDDNICPQIKCVREKGIAGCWECPEHLSCVMGFMGTDEGRFAKIMSEFISRHGREAYEKALRAISPEPLKSYDVLCDGVDMNADDACEVLIARLEKMLSQ